MNRQTKVAIALSLLVVLIAAPQASAGRVSTAAIDCRAWPRLTTVSWQKFRPERVELRWMQILTGGEVLHYAQTIDVPNGAKTVSAPTPAAPSTPLDHRSWARLTSRQGQTIEVEAFCTSV